MKDSSVSFNTILETAGIKNPDDWILEITDIDKFKRNLYVTDHKNHFTKVIDLRELKGQTILNIATKMIVDDLAFAKKSKARNEQQPRNAEDFFKFAKKNKFRIVGEFQDNDKQWVVYEIKREYTYNPKHQPEPDYWVTGDALDWQPGYQFNGSRWLFQKIKLDDQERLVIQNVVHQDIKDNQFEFTGSQDPFIAVIELVPDPNYDSTWRLYQSMDGKLKHWIDIIARPAYDRYYYKGEPLYYVTERWVDNIGPKPKIELSMDDLPKGEKL